jgi:hypothetical protein
MFLVASHFKKGFFIKIEYRFTKNLSARQNNVLGKNIG